MVTDSYREVTVGVTIRAVLEERLKVTSLEKLTQEQLAEYEKSPQESL